MDKTKINMKNSCRRIFIPVCFSTRHEPQEFTCVREKYTYFSQEVKCGAGKESRMHLKF